MKADGTDASKFAAMQGTIEALQAKDQARDASEKRTGEVATAMKRLEGRPLGADLEARLTNFHAEHGSAAFVPYVDAMAQTVGIIPGDNGAGAAFQGQAGKVPEVAMKYSDKGTDSVDKAAHFSREWKELSDTGHTRVSEERYVEINMAKSAV